MLVGILPVYQCLWSLRDARRVDWRRIPERGMKLRQVQVLHQDQSLDSHDMQQWLFWAGT